MNIHTQYNIEATINGEQVQIVKRHVSSPALSNGILSINDLGVRCNGPSENGDLVVTLRLTPAH